MIHEVKLDGYRILARIENAEVRLITRNDKDWSDLSWTARRSQPAGNSHEPQKTECRHSLER